jgi:DNA mismatch repair protein MutS
LAQIGSYVPAQRAHIGLVDALFTRIGFSDDFYKGQSTFMVEMMELSNLLENATSRSFVVVDEIGRGTAPSEGFALAGAILEHLTSLKVKTLFATHYLELSNFLSKKACYQMTIEKNKDGIHFLYHLEEGVNEHAYAIEVARLAGISSKITQRAGELLEVYRRHQLDCKIEK